MSRAGQLMTWTQFGYAARKLVEAREDKGVRLLDVLHAEIDGYEVALRIDGKVKRAYVDAKALWDVDTMLKALDRSIAEAISDVRMVVHVDHDPGDEHRSAA